MKKSIEQFLSSAAFGVVGASSNRGKFGNKVLRAYLEKGRRAIPVHPIQKEIEGVPCVAGVADLPPEVDSISVITPPQITEKIVDAALARGIRNIWMQPGAESAAAVEKCRNNHVNVIADGSCLLVEFGFREH